MQCITISNQITKIRDKSYYVILCQSNYENNVIIPYLSFLCSNIDISVIQKCTHVTLTYDRSK